MDKKRVLIVEDAAAMRMIIRNLLSASPYVTVVKSAANGQEALAALAEAQPDLILLDLDMPVMGGLEFLRQARSQTQAKIVILSVASIDSDIIRQAQLLGADAMVDKPSGMVSFDLEEKRGAQFWQIIHAVCGIALPPPIT